MAGKEQTSFDPSQKEADPRLDPLAPPTHEDFNWEALFALCDGTAELPEPDREKLCMALHEVFRFVVLSGGKIQAIGQRAVALSWVVSPDLWNGKSAAEVARYLGCPVQRLHVATGQARRRFGIANPGQRHAGNFKPAA